MKTAEASVLASRPYGLAERLAREIPSSTAILRGSKCRSLMSGEGHERTLRHLRMMSAYSLKTDIRNQWRVRHVRSVYAALGQLTSCAQDGARSYLKADFSR
jgi:hypothetical protein